MIIQTFETINPRLNNQTYSKSIIFKQVINASVVPSLTYLTRFRVDTISAWNKIIRENNAPLDSESFRFLRLQSSLCKCMFSYDENSIIPEHWPTSQN